MSFNLANLMHIQYTMSSTFDWEVLRLGMRKRVKTRNDNGLRIWIFSQKLPFFCGKKCFKDKFKKYNTIYLYVISQIFPTWYVWFQSSCGSMKSASSFSSIDRYLKCGNAWGYIHIYNYQKWKRFVTTTSHDHASYMVLFKKWSVELRFYPF